MSAESVQTTARYTSASRKENVDRPNRAIAAQTSGHSVLVSGLVLGAVCLAVVGSIPSFWLLVAMFARASGAEVHLMGRSPESMTFARELGFKDVWTEATLPSLAFDAVIDASNAVELPALALEIVEPAVVTRAEACDPEGIQRVRAHRLPMEAIRGDSACARGRTLPRRTRAKDV